MSETFLLFNIIEFKLKIFLFLSDQILNRSYWGHIKVILRSSEGQIGPDNIWLQWFLWWGPNMIAITVTLRTKYNCNLGQKSDDCNNDHNGDQIWLQPRKSSLSHVIMTWLWTNLVKTMYRRLQSYLVLFEKNCNHIWSILGLRLQSYLVPFLIINAFILRRFWFQDCNHIWSSSLLWLR